MPVLTKYEWGPRRRVNSSTGQVTYGSTQYLKYQKVTSNTVIGDHKSNYPYSTQKAIIVSNDGDNRRASWVNYYYGAINLTSFSALDVIPYVNGWYYAEPPGLHYPVAYQSALTSKCYAKLANSNFEFGEDLLEAKTTLSYLANRGRGVLAIASDIARLRLRSLSNRLGWGKKRKKKVQRKLDRAIGWKNKTSTLWLEARYAVRPLMISGENAVTAWQDGLGLEWKPTIRVRTGIEQPLKANAQTSNWERTASGSAIHRMQFDLELLDLTRLHSLQLGLDTSSLLWAGIPFSFCLDWLVGVAEFLKAAQIDSITDFVGGTQSVRVTGKVSHKGTKEGTGSYNRSEYTLNYWGYRRWVLNYAPVYLPRIKDPLNGGWRSFLNGVDAFALFF